MQEKSKRLQMPKTWVQNFGSFMRPQGIQDKPFKSWICIKRIIQSYKILVKITQHRSLGEQKAHLASWSDLLWCREAHWPENLTYWWPPGERFGWACPAPPDSRLIHRLVPLIFWTW